MTPVIPVTGVSYARFVPPIFENKNKSIRWHSLQTLGEN